MSKKKGYAYAYHHALRLAAFAHEHAVWLVDPSSETPNTELRQKGSYLSRTAKKNKIK